MADKGNENVQENIDNGMFAMYEDWAFGEVNAGEGGQGQEMSKNAVQEKSVPETPFDTLMNIVKTYATEELSSLKEIQQYMEEIRNQYKSMHSELQELRKQLVESRDNRGLDRQAVQGLEKNVNEMKEHCDGFNKNIFQKSAEIIRNFASKGKIALNGVVQKLGIKRSLEAERMKYMEKAEQMQKEIDKFDAISNEIYAVKSHIENIDRLTGEMPKNVGKYQKMTGDLEKSINRIDKLDRMREPYAKNMNRYLKLADRAEKKISRLEELEKRAAQAHSTLGKLSDYKKEVASRGEEKRTEHDKENIKKEPAVVL